MLKNYKMRNTKKNKIKTFYQIFLKVMFMKQIIEIQVKIIKNLEK